MCPIMKVFTLSFLRLYVLLGNLVAAIFSLSHVIIVVTAYTVHVRQFTGFSKRCIVVSHHDISM